LVAGEEGTLAALKAIRRELGDPKVKEHHLLLEFSNVVNAVRCAVEVQRQMAERNADVPHERRIEFRMGVNLGEVIRDGRDIFGDGVNIAARMEALVEPGGIYVLVADTGDREITAVDRRFLDREAAAIVVGKPLRRRHCHRVAQSSRAGQWHRNAQR
jgi:hypothetical protein